VTEPAGGRAGMHFQALSFGDVDGRVWGGALDAGGPAFAFGDGETTTSGAGSEAVRWTPDGRGWRLTGEGFDLHMEPGGEELPEPPDPDPGMTVSGMEELCRVQGTLTVAGAEHAVSGWFASDQALAVLSLRSRRSSGHESDLIAATLFDPDGWVPVKDPRLSTTYAQDGAPARVNLELWVGDEEEEYPRRAAGEAAGGAVSVSSGDFALRVAPMRCHSRGQAGAGVYVLATFA
jgi:hypothetical protein